MNKFYKVISNKWLKLGVSLLSLAYLAFVGILTWWTFLYEIRFNSVSGFNVIYITASVLFLAFMFYSRKQLPTRFISMILLFPVFLLILFNQGSPYIYIPPLIVGVILFFACGANESTKVIMGTIYILMYVVGLVGFMVACMLFGGSSVETRLDSTAPAEIAAEYDMAKIDNLNAASVSPDGKYRYYIVDVQDNSRGRVVIVVEPNDLDRTYRYFTLAEVGYSSRIAINYTRGVTPDIRWIDGSTISYTFGNGEWKSSTITPMKEKNYLRFLNIG